MDIPEKAKVIPECSRRGIIPQELARNIEARLEKQEQKRKVREIRTMESLIRKGRNARN